MKIIKQIMVAFVLFLVGAVYSQNVKQQSSVFSRVCFGKFVLDSIYTVSVKEILLSDSLFVIGGKESASGKIVSFDVYTRKDSISFTESIYGNRLSKKQKFMINSALPGQKIYFQNIMIRYSGKEKFKLNSSFIFKIKK